MKKKILILFVVYSYISLVCYVGSENFLNLAKGLGGNGNGKKKKLKVESLWKTTLKRYKEGCKLIMEN